MKRWISGFLMAFVAATPVLACCCPSAQESSSHHASGYPGDGHASHEHGNHDVSTAQGHQDCHDSCKQFLQAASVTTQDAQLPKIKTDFQPDLAAVVSTSFVFVELDLSDHYRWRLYKADHPDSSSLPIFLSTLRLRI